MKEKKGGLLYLHPTTYIDQVLLESLAQVFNKSRFTGEVLEQDKVLYSHPVPGRQGTLHCDPNSVTSDCL